MIFDGNVMKTISDRINYADYLQTNHWQQVRWAAIWLADSRCYLCDSRENLQVHHRNYDCLYKEKPCDVLVLCEKCHELISGVNKEENDPILSQDFDEEEEDVEDIFKRLSQQRCKINSDDID